MDAATRNMVEEAKDAIRADKMCKTCVFSNEPCTRCILHNKDINRAMYGCGDHLTDSQYLDRLAEEQLEEEKKKIARRYLEMDLMSYFIQGAMQILEKTDREQKAIFESIEFPTDEDKKRYTKKKDRRDKLRKGYIEMKCAAQDMRNAYNKYVQYYLDTLYNDKNGYDYKECDKSFVNAGYITAISAAILNKVMDSEENLNALMNFIFNLKGVDIMTKQECLRYLVNR